MDDLDLDDLGTGNGPHHIDDSLLNAENRKLKSEITTYEDESDLQSKRVEENEVRVKEMKTHLSNVKQEISNTQVLNEAQRKAIEAEDHMAQLAERDIGRVEQEIKARVKTLQDLQEKLDSVQNSVLAHNSRMEAEKVTMHFNQNELEQWDLVRKLKEDDVWAMEKYHKMDDAKTKDLNLQLEKLQKEVSAKRNELEREVTETQAAQIELDKTAEDFRREHKERSDMIRKWEETIQAIHKRDQAIKTAGERFAEGKAWQVKRTEQLQDRAAFLNLENQNNKEMGNKVAQEERVLSKYRNDHYLISQHLTELDDELEVLRNTLQKASQDLNVKKARKTQLMNQLQEKNDLLNRMQRDSEKTTGRLENEITTAGDLEKASKLVNTLLNETEGTLAKLDKEMHALKDEQYTKGQELFRVRTDEANLLANIRGAQSQQKNMVDKVKSLDQETFKQQELLYNIEFQVQQMERKVNRAKGERTEEEKKELKEKIAMLQTMLDDLQKQHKVLDLQVKRVMDEVRQDKISLNGRATEKERTSNGILELTLENESCGTELDKLRKEREGLMVNHDVLKLQINRMSDILNQKGHHLMSVANKKEQLRITIDEREAEIKLNIDVLRMEKKTSEEERRRLHVEVQERKSEVQHLKNRWQVLNNRIKRDQEDGEEMTHAQYIVRTAKEREELQAKGDSLDEQIKRMEKESAKLDKTIQAMKHCNSTFAAQFKRASANDPEAMTKLQLTTKTRELQEAVNKRTNEMKQCMKNELSKVNELQQCSRELEEYKHKKDLLQEGLAGLQKESGDNQNRAASFNNEVERFRTKFPQEYEEEAILQRKREIEDTVNALRHYAQHHEDPTTRAGMLTIIEQHFSS